MYFQMFKRDLKDKPGMNAVTFLFMVAAAVFMVIGSTLLYSLFAGEQKTYEKCHSSDIHFYTFQDMKDNDSLVAEMTENLLAKPEIKEVISDEFVIVNGTTVEFIGDDLEDQNKTFQAYYISKVPTERDLPIDMENGFFKVENGCIAVAQHRANMAGLKVGDKVRLTTQMGNTYEYVVSVIYKNPAVIQRDAFYLSDRDVEAFFAECPVKYNRLVATADTCLENYIDDLTAVCERFETDYEDYAAYEQAVQMIHLSNDGLFAIIVSLSMVIVAVVIMIMSMITIDFGLKSAIKRDEREIGMMKAIGVWSFSYKTLFVIKYLVFAVAGGVIGLPLGIILSRLLFDKFVLHVVFPDTTSLLVIGMIAAVVTIGLIILFSFFALRRMNKISVIDAIHGENRGERFAKLPGLALNTKNHMSVPFFMALSDILRGFKRYLLLIIAYVLGIAIVLFIVRLEDTLMSVDYAYDHFQHGRTDFAMEFDEPYYERLYSGTGSYSGVIDIVNRNFEENDVPASIYVTYEESAQITANGNTRKCQLTWHDAPSSEIRYLPGGNPPVLYNEIAISQYYADDENMKIGDTVSIKYYKYGDDHLTINEVTEDFIITALFDGFGLQFPKIVMADGFDRGVEGGNDLFSCVLDVPEKNYDEAFKKMQDLYPNGEITFFTRDEVMPRNLDGYKPMLDLLKLVISILVAIVLALLTAFYENIFIDEETADIALLKSMGFSKGTIRLWHFLRLMMMAILSMCLSYALMSTLGKMFVESLYTSLMRATTFNLKVQPVTNYVVIPIFVLAGLAIVTYIMTRLTSAIQIWKVRNE